MENNYIVENSLSQSEFSVHSNMSNVFILNPNANCFHSQIPEIVSGFLSATLDQSLYPNSDNSENFSTVQNVETSNIVTEDPYTVLKDIRMKNIHKIVIGHLNVNSIRNKIDVVSDLIIGNIDIFLITESKIDNTFPTSQFKIFGYHLPYRKDRSKWGVGFYFT